jgi:hypothetical protein
MKRDTDTNDNTFQLLATSVGSVMDKIVAMRSAAAAGGDTKRDLVSQAGVGARGSVVSSPSSEGVCAIASLGGGAFRARAGASRLPLLYVATTLSLDIGDWPIITDLPAEYIVQPSETGEIKLVGVAIKTKDGSRICIGELGKIPLGHGQHLTSYLARAIWAAADLQFFTAKQQIAQE